jgi:hypothetical protein
MRRLGFGLIFECVFVFLHSASPVMLLAFRNLYKRRDWTIQCVGDGAE